MIQRGVFPLQTSIPDAISATIADAIAYLPTLVGALVILLVGYIVGRLLGGLVTRIVRRIGLGRFTRGTALESETEGDESDSLARALGKLVAFYVYFVALLAAANVLGIAALSEVLGTISDFLPVVFGAIVVLVLGFIVGRVLGDIVADLVGGFNIGPYLRDTPLERFGDQEGEFGRLVGKLVTYYVYLLTLLTVADIVQIPALTRLLNTFVAYLPALVGGLIVLLVGIWAAERAADLVASGGSQASNVAAMGVKLLIYYITITIALGAIGFETTILTTLFTAFAVALFGAIGLALAIGIGVAVGLGGQDYVAANIHNWASSAREMTESEREG